MSARIVHNKTDAEASALYTKYTTVTYSGRKLLEKYSLDETGTWEVKGEDPNCDLGGHHYEPFLGYFEGTLRSVIELAVCLSGFWQWGAGGNIKKVIVTSATERAEIEREIRELRTRLAELEELVR